MGNPMNAPLTATLTRTHEGAPLAVVDNLPGGFAELRPAQLRALAAALQVIAADCEAHHKRGKRAAPARKSYPLPAHPALKVA